MLLSTSFKDAVVDAMVTKLNYGIPRHLHLVFYTGSNSQSMARKLAVDVIVWKCPAGYFNKEHFGDASEEFRWDLLSRLGKVKDTGKGVTVPWTAGGCTYHDHVAAGLPCYKELF